MIYLLTISRNDGLSPPEPRGPFRCVLARTVPFAWGLSPVSLRRSLTGKAAFAAAATLVSQTVFN